MPTALGGFFKGFRKCCLVAGAFAALRLPAVTEFPMTGFLVAVTLVSFACLSTLWHACCFGWGAPTSHSEWGEDMYILRNFFPNEHAGVYVEAGAIDGLELSNTKLFEERGWRGVLVEPNPTVAARCERNRPHDKVYSCLLGATESTGEFQVIDGDRESHVKNSTHVPKSNRCCGVRCSQRFKYTFGRVCWCCSRREAAPVAATIPVHERPVGKVLKEAGVKKVDFFSLDVEGYELHVLNGMDWSIEVQVWLIEIHETCEDGPAIRKLLEEKGYVFFGRVHWNAVWLSADFATELVGRGEIFPYPKCLAWWSAWAEFGKRWQTAVAAAPVGR